MSEAERPAGTDDRAALEALEHLQRQIEESRRRRRETSDEFESFVRSFKSPAGRSEPSPAPSYVRSGPRTSELPAVSPQRESPPLPLPPAPERSRRKPALAVAALVALLLIGWWLMRPPSAIAPAEPPAAPAVEPTAVPAPAPVTAVPPPAAELRTVRRVWMRVLVDGQRRIEREVEADTRIPFENAGQITIRAGDGGAVRLLVRGEDRGALGTDGFPVTRTFTVPAPPR